MCASTSVWRHIHAYRHISGPATWLHILRVHTQISLCLRGFNSCTLTAVTMCMCMLCISSWVCSTDFHVEPCGRAWIWIRSSLFLFVHATLYITLSENFAVWAIFGSPILWNNSVEAGLSNIVFIYRYSVHAVETEQETEICKQGLRFLCRYLGGEFQYLH